jgi:hypothetical protein
MNEWMRLSGEDRWVDSKELTVKIYSQEGLKYHRPKDAYVSMAYATEIMCFVNNHELFVLIDCSL